MVCVKFITNIRNVHITDLCTSIQQFIWEKKSHFLLHPQITD